MELYRFNKWNQSHDSFFHQVAFVVTLGGIAEVSCAAGEAKEDQQPSLSSPYVSLTILPLCHCCGAFLHVQACLVQNTPPAPGRLFVGVACASALGRDLTHVLKSKSIFGNQQVWLQPIIFKTNFPSFLFRNQLFGRNNQSF